MYKFTSHLTNSHLVLVRKKLSDGSCAALVVMRAPVRRYATEFYAEKCPPPPPPKPKSRKLLFGAIGAAILTGAGCVYAKHTPEIRNWLASNAPWADDFVALVYQENTTYTQFTMDQIHKLSVAISDFLFGKEGVSPPDIPPRAHQDIDADALKGFAPKEYELPIPLLDKLYVEEKVQGPAEVEHEATLVQTEACDPPEDKPAGPIVTKDIVELEEEMYTSTKLAIDSFKKASKLCIDYNKIVSRIVETPLEEMEQRTFSSLSAVRKERNDTIKRAKDSAAKARSAINSLEGQLVDPIPIVKITQTKRFINQFLTDLRAAEDEFARELDKSYISDRYWDKVEAARKAYKQELEILFPGIDLCTRRLDITEDSDLLLLYTMKQIALLQNELAELQTVREHNINKAIECHEEKALIDAKVEEMIKKERLAKELEFQKKNLKIMRDANHKLRDELHKQYLMHEDLMKKRLKAKEDEIMGKMNKRVSELVEKDRIEYKKELAVMAGKLKAIEATLKQHASAEAAAKRSQSIWTAAEALLAATRRAAPDAHIQPELNALEKAAKDDKLVKTVLGAISKEAREEGIVTEKSLKDRFDMLEKTASKVALVGRDGASLPIYFLSWLQSKLLFQKLAEIPRDELNNLPTDFSKLDTFDIIQRARYHMDHGNLEAALRYVNLLQGAPRAAAACWAQAARRHLEVRQAAEAVMAHATLSALHYD